MNQYKKIAESLVFIVLFILLTNISCGSDSPPVNLAKSDFINRNTESQKFYSIVSFDKTDGIVTNMLGTNVYIMSWRAIIELNRDCSYYIYQGRPGAMESLMGFDISITINGPSSHIFPLGWKKYQGKKGQRITLDGHSNFVKSERGWNLFKL